MTYSNPENAAVLWLIEQLEHDSAPQSFANLGLLKHCHIIANAMDSMTEDWMKEDFPNKQELFRQAAIIDGLITRATTEAADLERALPGLEPPLYERLSNAISKAYDPAESLAGKIAKLRENKFTSNADYIRLVVAEYGYLMPEVLKPSHIRVLLKQHGVVVTPKNIRDVVSRIDNLKNKENPHERQRPSSDQPSPE